MVVLSLYSKDGNYSQIYLRKEPKMLAEGRSQQANNVESTSAMTLNQGANYICTDLVSIAGICLRSTS